MNPYKHLIVSLFHSVFKKIVKSVFNITKFVFTMQDCSKNFGVVTNQQDSDPIAATKGRRET